MAHQSEMAHKQVEPSCEINLLMKTVCEAVNGVPSLWLLGHVHLFTRKEVGASAEQSSEDDRSQHLITYFASHLCSSVKQLQLISFQTLIK